MIRCNYAKSQCFCYNNQENDENNDYFSDYYSNNFLSICLLNCSNNGLCRVDDLNNKSYCECNQYFTGNDCSYDLRPCSRKFNCLNGKCINKLEIIPYDFDCKCEYPWYGRHCELKINLCENMTCSKQGICYSNLTLPMCKCFPGYSGTNCEIKSEEMKIKQIISNGAVAASILFFLMFTILIIFLDCVNRKKFKKFLSKKKQNRI